MTFRRTVPAAAAGLPAGRVTAPCHPPRSHELLVYNDAAETMADFFVRFERHCASGYRGTYDDTLPLLRSKLSGRVLELFDANGPRSSYQVIKRRLLEWAPRQGGFEVSSATAMYRDAARRPGESLAVYAFRLVALFEDVYPEVDKQVRHDLHLKLLSALPTCAADLLRRQLRWLTTTQPSPGTNWCRTSNVRASNRKLRTLWTRCTREPRHSAAVGRKLSGVRAAPPVPG